MSKLWIQNAKYPTGDAIEHGDILCVDGAIESVGHIIEAENAQILDAEGDWILPGFLDLHTHGAMGVDVNSADADGIRRIARFLAAHGVTGFLCSILTDTEERTLRAIEAVREAMHGAGGAQVLGVHLEGPFLSEVYAGAMPKELLRSADAEWVFRCLKAASGAIKTITVAPEAAGVPELIPTLVREGIVVMLGHSNATYAEAKRAIDAGARGITHTCNAMRLFHQHEPAIMGAALLQDVSCEVIADGLHLHPDALRLLVHCKGADRIIAVSDSIMATGLSDGDYRLGANEITVTNGDAKLKGQNVRAGSTLTLDRAYNNLITYAGMTQAQAAKATATNAANLLGRSDLGRIAPGARADLVRLDASGVVRTTLIGAKTVFQKT